MDYYERLTAVRQEGDWEGWLKFFLRGVYEVSLAATDTARQILQLREQHRSIVQPLGRFAPSFLDLLYDRPVVSVDYVAKQLECSQQTATSLIRKFSQQNLLVEITGKQRYQRYRYESYLATFENQGLVPEQDDTQEPGDIESTES